MLITALPLVVLQEAAVVVRQGPLSHRDVMAPEVVPDPVRVGVTLPGDVHSGAVLEAQNNLVFAALLVALEGLRADDVIASVVTKVLDLFQGQSSFW